MTLAPHHRRELLMLGHTNGSRSATVCHYKCGDACAHEAPNQTATASYFPEIVAQTLKRRTVLGGGLAAFAAAAAGSVASAAPAMADAIPPIGAVPGYKFNGTTTIDFTPISAVAKTVDEVTVPDGWTWGTVIAWGDKVLPYAKPFDPDNVTADTQKYQFGYNNDYLTIIPLPASGRTQRGLLVANHEYYNPELMFADWGIEATPAKALANLEAAMYSMGMSVVVVSRRDGKLWQPDPIKAGTYNRRITFTNAFDLDGPAKGSALLKTAADPTGSRVLGTMNNCAGGTTPWGTVLSGEENFNFYFKAPADAATKPELVRYGINTAGSGWEKIDPRFDLSIEPNEANRFGWVVEVDPFVKNSRPVKHTALGRFKHEGATIRIAASGHAVAYMGDDERFDYLYKFVSKGTFDARSGEKARNSNKKLLSEGNLYVAKFAGDSTADSVFDGTGQWLPLIENGVSKVPGFTVEQVLVFTRRAADVLAPTKMDRPEDVQPNPKTGRVYVACTNNTQRDGVRLVRGELATTDEANPRLRNKDGHVVELIEDGNDATSLTFTWNLVLVCGNPADTTIPTYFGGYTGEVSPISCPDNVAFDGAGNLWISTDGAPDAIGYNDALHRVVLEGPDRGKVEQFLAVPTGAETCGPIVDSDDGSVFVAVQHPGDVLGASYAAPASAFPYLDDGFDGPRPAVIQVFRG